MFSIYTNLKNDWGLPPAQYRAATGLDFDKFKALHQIFSSHFVAKKSSKVGGKITRFIDWTCLVEFSS